MSGMRHDAPCEHVPLLSWACVGAFVTMAHYSVNGTDRLIYGLLGRSIVGGRVPGHDAAHTQTLMQACHTRMQHTLQVSRQKAKRRDTSSNTIVTQTERRRSYGER